MGGTKEQLDENFNPKLLFDISSFKSFFQSPILEYALNNHKEVSKTQETLSKKIIVQI